jgi:hypothetical protein
MDSSLVLLRSKSLQSSKLSNLFLTGSRVSVELVVVEMLSQKRRRRRVKQRLLPKKLMRKLQ